MREKNLTKETQLDQIYLKMSASFGHHVMPNNRSWSLERQPSSSAPARVVNFSVGGVWFTAARDTLARISTSNLSKIEEGSFIDRDPLHFRYILNALRGTVVLPQDRVTLSELRAEADYYNLPELVSAIELKLATAPPPREVTLERIEKALLAASRV